MAMIPVPPNLGNSRLTSALFGYMKLSVSKRHLHRTTRAAALTQLPLSCSSALKVCPSSSVAERSPILVIIPFITENYRPVLMSTPNVVVQPSDDVGDQGSAAEIGRVSASRTEILGERRKEVKLSVWRKEQIKYTKRARLEPNATPKPIPALHGPLSLPYSRNPR